MEKDAAHGPDENLVRYLLAEAGLRPGADELQLLVEGYARLRVQMQDLRRAELTETQEPVTSFVLDPPQLSSLPSPVGLSDHEKPEQ